MRITPLHDPKTGPLRLAALMSGSGTNVRRILEHAQRLCQAKGASPFEVVVIFSDRCDSKAAEIGRDYDIPVVIHDLKGWLAKHGVPRKDLTRREDFDRQTVAILRPFAATAAIYGGYMAIASPTLIDAFLGINVHPADLSVQNPDGKRKWRGAHAVKDAIVAGEKTIRSSTHLIAPEVDAGPLLMISAPLPVQLPPGANLADHQTLNQIADLNQERLKQAGDWVIFPKTIERIARGLFQRDDHGNIHYRGQPAPHGVKLEEVAGSE